MKTPLVAMAKTTHFDGVVVDARTVVMLDGGAAVGNRQRLQLGSEG
jgi:hypothetical protein